jgi:anti-sigma-K factor RskA
MAPGAVVEAFSDGSVRLIPLQDIAVPQGRALQVWTLRDRQEGPISVGLMDKAQTLHLDLGKLPAPRVDQLFEITLEPETGSPTGRPTGPVLMKGLASNTL